MDSTRDNRIGIWVAPHKKPDGARLKWPRVTLDSARDKVCSAVIVKISACGSSALSFWLEGGALCVSAFNPSIYASQRCFYCSSRRRPLLMRHPLRSTCR